MNLDLTDRTPAEELWLARRAKGYTTAAMAARLGVGRTTYWTYESGAQEPPARGWRALETPALPLLLALARRRAGWTLRTTAKRVGACHVILLRWEHAGDPGLQAWWEQRGLIFSK